MITEVMARSVVGSFLVDNGHHYVDLFYNCTNKYKYWRQLLSEDEDLYLAGFQIQGEPSFHGLGCETCAGLEFGSND